MLLKFAPVVLVFIVNFNCLYAITVCGTFVQYNLPFQIGCSNNPDGESNVIEIMQRWGFTAQAYEVTTDDGYKIYIARGYKYNPLMYSNGVPVVFGHGILTNANYWVTKGKSSLPYVLGDLGYDIWIISFRGTRFSRGHTYLADTDEKYWKYSFYEKGIYDLSAVLQGVNTVTGRKSIYIGYSMGTTIGFVYSIEKPSEAKELLLGMVQLAPVAYMANVRGYFVTLPYIYPSWKELSYYVNHGEAFGVLRTSLIADLFAHRTLKMLFFQTKLSMFFGFDFEQLDPIQIPVTLSIGYDSVAVDVIVHFGQLMRSNRFQRFDYGAEQNWIKYGHSTPPLLNLTQITVPVAMFAGRNDYIATVEDAYRINSELPPASRCGYYIMGNPKFNHVDFIEARDVKAMLYDDVIKIVDKFSKGVCT